MYETSHGKFGSLIGHIDKFNPHIELLQENIPAQAIFHGPNCYISPNVYSTTQLPTWNYVKVHISGNVTRIPANDDVIQSIANMTSFFQNTTKIATSGGMIEYQPIEDPSFVYCFLSNDS